MRVCHGPIGLSFHMVRKSLITLSLFSYCFFFLLECNRSEFNKVDQGAIRVGNNIVFLFFSLPNFRNQSNHLVRYITVFNRNQFHFPRASYFIQITCATKKLFKSLQRRLTNIK